MTQHDADQLKAWINALTTEQLGLLWRWVFIAYFQRLEQDTRARHPAP